MLVAPSVPPREVPPGKTEAEDFLSSVLDLDEELFWMKSYHIINSLNV